MKQDWVARVLCEWELARCVVKWGGALQLKPSVDHSGGECAAGSGCEWGPKAT